MTHPDDLCHACQEPLKTPEERERRLCDACVPVIARKTPVRSLRPGLPCTRCDHTQFVRAVLQDRSDNALKPAALAFGFSVQHSTWSGKVTGIVPDEREWHGTLLAHVCRGCGLTEIYTTGFADIPIGPQYGTELIDLAPHGPDAGPFR